MHARSVQFARVDDDKLAKLVVRFTGLRRAIEVEIGDTAKAKAAVAKDKKDTKDKKAKAAATVKGSGKGKLYNYLPMAGLFIDEDELRVSSSTLPLASDVAGKPSGSQ